METVASKHKALAIEFQVYFTELIETSIERI